MNKVFEIKGDCTLEDFKYMSPLLLNMITFINLWCIERNVILYWTSFISDRKPEHSRPPHSDGRAGDLSLLAAFGWTTDLIDEFRYDIDKEFKKIGALVLDKSVNKLISKPIYIHGKGSAYHAHIQVRKITSP